MTMTKNGRIVLHSLYNKTFNQMLNVAPSLGFITIHQDALHNAMLWLPYFFQRLLFLKSF